MRFVWIWLQTAIISLYSVNWLVCVTETVTICTASLTFNNSAFCLHSVFMCFVWIWEQTPIISIYSVKWLVCITQTVTICTSSLTFNNSTFCPHSVFMCFVWIWEQTAIISPYNINCLVFINERDNVYCAVRTGSLNQTYTVSSLKGKETAANVQFCGWKWQLRREKELRETWVLDDGLLLGLRPAYSSDISTFRTASIFIVSELVHIYTAVVWKKTCDGYTVRYEGEWQIAATEDRRRGQNFPQPMTVQYFQEDPPFFGLQQWDMWN